MATMGRAAEGKPQSGKHKHLHRVFISLKYEDAKSSLKSVNELKTVDILPLGNQPFH